MKEDIRTFCLVFAGLFLIFVFILLLVMGIILLVEFTKEPYDDCIAKCPTTMLLSGFSGWSDLECPKMCYEIFVEKESK